jgi:hypothetical protein
MPGYLSAIALSRSEIAAMVLMAIALPLVIKLHLLPALFAGLLMHELVHLLAPRLLGANHGGRGNQLVTWLREHAKVVKTLGGEIGHGTIPSFMAGRI